MANGEKPDGALCTQRHEKKPVKLHGVGILIGGRDRGLPRGGQRAMEDSEPLSKCGSLEMFTTAVGFVETINIWRRGKDTSGEDDSLVM